MGGHGYAGMGYYGERSADAEPEADAGLYYGGYGYGAGLGYAGLGYGYSGLGYAGYGGYGLGYGRLGYAVLATMARGLLMLSQRLMLVCTMEDMDMVLVWDMLDLDMDIPVLDMLDMGVMDSDTVLDMDVPSMVKQLIYASKSSKVIFLLFSALIW